MLVYNIVHNSLYFHIKKHYQPLVSALIMSYVTVPTSMDFW